MSLEEWMKAFMRMEEMVEEMYKKIHPKEEEESLVKGEGGGEGGDPLTLLHHHLVMVLMEILLKKFSITHNALPSHKTLLKLYVKFDLSIKDGEMNVEN